MALAVTSYPSGESPVTPGIRTLLRVLRGAAWIMVFLLALSPVLKWPEFLSGRFRVILLTDRSLSMELPAGRDTGSRSARAEALRLAFRRQAGSGLDLVERSFARGLADSAGNPDPAFRGATALGDALASSGGFAAGRPAAVLVVSDGAVTQGEDPWAGAERLGLPVFTALAADSTPGPDAALSQVATNSTAYVGRPTPVLVTVRSRGLAGRDATLELREDGRVLDRARVRLTRGGETEVSLAVTPQSPGAHFYEVAIPGIPGELTERNNKRLVSLDVLADKARVVMVQTSPSFDFSFVRRSLEEEPDLAGEFWTAGPQGVYLRVGTSERATPAQLAQRIASASIVALGDLEGAPGATAILSAAAARVRDGAGLWIYGGNPRAGLGALRGTPVAPLLPFEVERLNGPALSLSPEPAAESHGEALFGDGGASPGAMKQWQDLPPSSGVRDLPLRAGARRLLSASRGALGTLGASIRPPGGGRVFALNTGQMYRWTFTAQGAPGGNDVFPAFLSRVWRWLNEPGAGPALSVRPGRRVVPLGELLTADVTGVRSGERADVQAVDARGHATPMKVSLLEGAAHAEASLAPGRYRIVARALRAGSETGRAQAEAAVEETGAEWIESAPDAGSLARTAKASGGKSFASTDTSGIVKALVKESRRPRGTRESALNREAWPYALVLALLGAEWWIRRRRGLP